MCLRARPATESKQTQSPRAAWLFAAIKSSIRNAVYRRGVLADAIGSLEPRPMSVLLGLCDLNRAEAVEWAIDEEDLHRDVRLDVCLAQEREDLATCELLDRTRV